MSRRKIVTINDLPLRPRALAEAEISAIFGGCIKEGMYCGGETSTHTSNTGPCCPGLICTIGQLQPAHHYGEHTHTKCMTSADSMAGNQPMPYPFWMVPMW